WTARELLGASATQQKFLRGAAVVGVVMAVAAMFQQALGDSVTAAGLLPGYFGTFVYRNQFAAFLEALLPVAIVAAIDDRRRAVPWIGAAAAMFAGIVAAGSRTGVVISLALLVAVPAAASLRGSIPRVALVRLSAAVLLCAAVLTAVAGWETVWARFQEPQPYSLRAELVQSTAAMIAERPLTGFGLGAWPVAYPAFARFDDGSFVNQAHNDWMQWAAEGGLPMFLLMLWIVVRAVPAATRSLWGLGILAVFVHALVDYPFGQRPALAAFFFVLLGIISAERSGRADTAK
ncbi:MAG: O-antigen ligase family protein, partial [Bryobacteraceae bacterium]